MRELLAIVLVPSVTGFLWLVSARRTPWALAWFAGGIALSLAGVAAGLGALADPHSDLASQLGVEFIFVAIAAMTAGVTEMLAHERGNVIERHRTGGTIWRVETRTIKGNTYNQRRDKDEGLTEVLISAGRNSERVIGVGDPYEKEEAFMDLVAEAEQAAAQYNAHQIGP